MFDNIRPKVSIIDYGMGNLFSVQKACEYVGLEANVTFDQKDILKSDAVILPGVGAFGDAMSNLNKLGLVLALKDLARSGKPFFGICLGMQLLMSESEEFGSHQGLNIFPGRVVRFPERDLNGSKIKVPEVGWNEIRMADQVGAWDDSLLRGVASGEFMYFVHSFYVVPESKDAVLSVSTYEGIEYCSGISAGNVFACQYHPERSGQRGVHIYRNFAKMIKNGGRNNDE
ncbi:MAG: imidazole glycerol phosphate synthase subunit HisH [Candidatus Margulisiibacteriota bacterium]